MLPIPLHLISNSPRASSQALPASLQDSKPKPESKKPNGQKRKTKAKDSCSECSDGDLCRRCLIVRAVHRQGVSYGNKVPSLPKVVSSGATKSVLGKRKPGAPHDLQTRPTAILKTNHPQTNYTSHTSKTNKTNVTTLTVSSNAAESTTSNTHLNGVSSSAATASSGHSRSGSRCLEYQCHADMLAAVKHCIAMFPSGSSANVAAISPERRLTFKGYFSIIEDPKMSLKARGREMKNELKEVMRPMRVTSVSTVELSPNAEKCTQIWHCQCDHCRPPGPPVLPSVASISTFDPSAFTKLAPVKKATKQSTLGGFFKKPSTPTAADDTTSDMQEGKSGCGFLKITVQVDKSHKLCAGKIGKGIKGRKITVEFEHLAGCLLM